MKEANKEEKIKDAKAEKSKPAKEERTSEVKRDDRLTKEEIREGAPFAALSYIFFLWILTFIFKRENRFAHFHARQGIVIFMGEIFCAFLFVVPVLGVFFGRLGLMILFCVSLYGIYTSLTGKVRHINIVTEIAQKLVI